LPLSHVNHIAAKLRGIRPAEIEEHLNDYYSGMGRPHKSRAAIARAFIAKMVYNMPTTRMFWSG